MKIHTGDTVVIITGKDKGKSGRVTKILSDKNRVVVEGINMRTRHVKKTTQGPGQRLVYEASLHASNVMIVDPKTKKATRIGFKMDEKKGKIRIAKASGEVIAKAAKAAPAAKGAKKSDDKPKKDASDAKAPTKQPFWKRSEGGGSAAANTAISEEKTGGSASMPSAHRSQGG